MLVKVAASRTVLTSLLSDDMVYAYAPKFNLPAATLLGFLAGFVIGFGLVRLLRNVRGWAWFLLSCGAVLLTWQTNSVR